MATDSVHVRLASRFGRETAIFGSAMVGGLLLAMLTAVVLAHYLTPSQYGELAILVFYASLLTVLINAGSLQGTLITVFGEADEDDVGEADTGPGAIGLDRRRMLTSALGFTVLLAAAVVAASALASSALTRLLIGRGHPHYLVTLAAASGAIGAVWRLAVNVARLERRTVVYAMLHLLRPLIALAVTVPMVASGEGIRGGLVGLVAGSTFTLVAILLVTRRSYRFAVSGADVGRCVKAGLPYVPITLSGWFVHSGGVFLISRYRSKAEVAVFSLATRLTVLNTYWVSAFLMSYSPVRRTSLFAAAERRPQLLRSRLSTYFVLVSLLVFLSLSLLANELVRVLPSSYAGAARVVPLAALGWTVYGFFILSYRLCEIPRKRRAYVLLMLLSAALFALASVLLDPPLGAQGQALAMVVAYAVPLLILLVVIIRVEGGLAFDPLRVSGAIALAAACFFAFRGLSDRYPGLRLLAELGGCATYLVGLPALGIVPHADQRALARSILGMIPRPGRHRRLNAALAELPQADVELLDALVRNRDPRIAAAALEMSEPEFYMRSVAVLRKIAGLGGQRVQDIRVGAYLLSSSAVAERDVLARRLWQEVDPAELDALETTLRVVKRRVRRGSLAGYGLDASAG